MGRWAERAGTPWGRAAPVQRMGSESMLWGREGEMLVHCHVEMIQAKFPIFHRRVTLSHHQLQWPLSVHLSLVQLDLYKLILLNLLFPVNLMWQKGVFFLCANSFLAVIILSQNERFPFSSRMLWQLFQKSNSAGHEGAGSQEFLRLSPPTKSPWHLRVPNGEISAVLSAGWGHSLSYFLLARCHSYLLCIWQLWFPDKHSVSAYCCISTVAQTASE